MNNETILKKCIEKVIENGWDLFVFLEAENGFLPHRFVYNRKFKEIELKRNLVLIWYTAKDEFRKGKRVTHTKMPVSININSLLFNHSFLKSMFGKNMVCSHCGHKELGKDKDGDTFCKKCMYITTPSISWKYHGKELLYSTDRLKYMEQFIK